MTSAEAVRYAYLAAMKRWHRHSIDGLERLTAPGPKLVVAYHGRGIPLDLALVGEEIRKRSGYLPRNAVHAGLWAIPKARPLLEAAGCVPGDGPELRAALGRGEVVFIAPGGTHEGLRTFRERYRVDWGKRRGYLRLAQELGVPLIPLATAGVDDRFIGLNDGHALGKALGLPARWPFWLALGPFGLYPFTADFPVRFHTAVGTPIDLSSLPSIDPDWLERAHAAVTAEVQRLLDRARAEVSP